MLRVLAGLCLLLPLALGSYPSYHGCMTNTAESYPYCDTSKSFEDRVESLIDELSLEELIGTISPDRSVEGICNAPIASIPRLGLPEYMWLVETNTAVAAAAPPPPLKPSTTFVGPMGLGASFNRSSWYAKGDVISTELRAYNNYGWYRGVDGPFRYYRIGLTGFGPNINNQRDPRFGRSSELPGEDPYLSGQYATSYVQGIQQVDDKGYVKMLAYLKHFDVYSLETNRMHSNANISVFDFWDSYLPQYETAMTVGNASGVMCSYASANGIPSCASSFLLKDTLRAKWKRPDAVVMSDCGAISNTMGSPLNLSPTEAAAYTVGNGTDVEAGTTVWTEFLAAAVNQSLISVDTIKASVRRTFLQLFRAGRFDPNVSWMSIGMDQVGSAAHTQVSYEAALQSFVLLKNDKGGLPLARGANIAVVGPQGVAQAGLLSDYAGDQQCYNAADPQAGTDACITSIGAAITAVNTGGNTTVDQGVGVTGTDKSGVAAALAHAKAADVVVLVLGIDKTVEHEGIDRVNISLPGLQEEFGQSVLALGRPTVLVLVNGGQLGIDNLVAGPVAIVEAFNPAVNGADALAATLFGQENRWGKLPYTMYPADIVNQLELTDFDMSKAPGRTYKYYTGTPLFPFGFGLSLTTFTMTVEPTPSPSGTVGYRVQVTNTGSITGDEVVMIFHSVGSDIRSKVDHPVPLKHLVQFERMGPLAPSAAAVHTFVLERERVLALVNSTGDSVVYPGTHFLTFSRGHGDDVKFTLTV